MKGKNRLLKSIGAVVFLICIIVSIYLSIQLMQQKQIIVVLQDNISELVNESTTLKEANQDYQEEISKNQIDFAAISDELANRNKDSYVVTEEELILYREAVINEFNHIYRLSSLEHVFALPNKIPLKQKETDYEHFAKVIDTVETIEGEKFALVEIFYLDGFHPIQLYFGYIEVQYLTDIYDYSNDIAIVSGVDFNSIRIGDSINKAMGVLGNSYDRIFAKDVLYLSFYVENDEVSVNHSALNDVTFLREGTNVDFTRPTETITGIITTDEKVLVNGHKIINETVKQVYKLFDPIFHRLSEQELLLYGTSSSDTIPIYTGDEIIYFLEEGYLLRFYYDTATLDDNSIITRVSLTRAIFPKPIVD